MKVSKTITLLTTASTVLLHAMNVIDHVIRNTHDGDEIDQDVLLRQVTGEAPHSILSYPADVVRELLDEIGDDMIPEELQDIRTNLYPHKYKDDYRKMSPAVQAVFNFAHELSSEMYDAKKKFDLN